MNLYIIIETISQRKRRVEKINLNDWIHKDTFYSDINLIYGDCRTKIEVYQSKENPSLILIVV